MALARENGILKATAVLDIVSDALRGSHSLIYIAVHTDSSSHINSSGLTLESQNYPPSEIGTLGNPVPQHLHGNHGDNQSRWSKPWAWPS